MNFVELRKMRNAQVRIASRKHRHAFVTRDLAHGRCKDVMTKKIALMRHHILMEKNRCGHGFSAHEQWILIAPDM